VQAFDLLVVGGGSGGLATAQRAVEYGARVALFEPNRLGGTCVNVGCVPKKVMWNAAELAAAIEHAPRYGFDVTVGRHDWAKLKQGRDAYVARLNGIYERNLDKKGITTIRSAARFTGAHELVDTEGRTYGAKHVVIATGGAPGVPTLTGSDLGETSDDFFEWSERPGKVAIVGSGYIAVELAGVLRALGSEVVLVLRGGRLLRQFDAMLGDKLVDAMRVSGIEVLTEFMADSVERHAGGIVLKSADGRGVAGCDRLVWAVGRKPRTQGLGLAAAGVATNAGGYIAVDEYQNTNVAGIYAVGDVTGQAELTPVAIAAGRRLADRVFGGQKDRHLRYDMIPTVVFSHPPVGTVGLSEQAARERYPNEPIRIYQADFVSMFYALTEVKPRTWMKLVAVGADERIVGCHMIGQAADEIIQGFAVALTMGARKRDLDDTLAIHPTSAEELVTMR
jgi:glutathione reductase (NADPH)